MRCFAAVFPGEGLRDGLAAFQSELRRVPADVKWVEPANVHLTIKFLGEVAPARLAALVDALRGAARGIRPFRLEVRGAGAFPNLRRPRVFWVGLGEGVDGFESLWRSVEDASFAAGFEREPRGFSPHVTLGRARGPGAGGGGGAGVGSRGGGSRGVDSRGVGAARSGGAMPPATAGTASATVPASPLAARIQAAGSTCWGWLDVRGFGLVESALSRSGPVYSVIEEFPLSG